MTALNSPRTAYTTEPDALHLALRRPDGATTTIRVLPWAAEVDVCCLPDGPYQALDECE